MGICRDIDRWTWPGSKGSRARTSRQPRHPSHSRFAGRSMPDIREAASKRRSPISPQEVLDGGLEFFGVIRPVTVDFEAVSADGPAGGGAPVLHRLMCGGDLSIGTAMDHPRRLTRRCHDTFDFSLSGERTDHLDTKIDRQRGGSVMMIKKDV